ncbi:MAG: methyltransferase domain-containing protein [Candidatus Nomurabacteria bacterium]|jgi:ubiquinone/menaquinone biosynthesis C-methylase UbiE|nr:methyltransferase domain-containing protein [Candidatus Nomurabacteria bacterium]
MLVAGGGYVSSELYQRCGCTIIGVDISPNAIQLAKKVCRLDKGVTLHQESVTDMSIKSKSADLVLAVGCLEHVEDLDLALEEVYRVLKPGGYLYVVTSNYYSFVHFIAYKLRQKLGIWPYGYEKDWKSVDFCQKLAQAGFKKDFLTTQFGIGDFWFLDVLDRAVAPFDKRWGRYICWGGKKA